MCQRLGRLFPPRHRAERSTRGSVERTGLLLRSAEGRLPSPADAPALRNAEQLPLDLHGSTYRMGGLEIRRRIWSSAAEVADIPARVSIGETISLILKGSEMSSKAVCSGGSNYEL